MSGSGRTDYDEFFTAARPQLVGLAFALTGDIQVAHELAQEALVRAWINWRKIRSYDDPSAWARRVVRNLAANHSRHLRLAPALPPMKNVSAPTTDRLAMIDALAQLPAPQREALVLHDGLGVPVAEVASELGVPEGTVRSWLSRGRAVLSPILSAGDDTREVKSDERS